MKLEDLLTLNMNYPLSYIHAHIAYLKSNGGILVVDSQVNMQDLKNNAEGLRVTNVNSVVNHSFNGGGPYYFTPGALKELVSKAILEDKLGLEEQVRKLNQENMKHRNAVWEAEQKVRDYPYTLAAARFDDSKVLGEWSAADCFKEFEVSKENSDDIAELYITYYNCEGYEGDAFVLYKDKEGKLIEVNGSHCSCYGLEGQWSPTETTIEALKHRVANGRDYSGGKKHKLIQKWLATNPNV